MPAVHIEGPVPARPVQKSAQIESLYGPVRNSELWSCQKPTSPNLRNIHRCRAGATGLSLVHAGRLEEQNGSKAPNCLCLIRSSDRSEPSRTDPARGRHFGRAKNERLA